MKMKWALEDLETALEDLVEEVLGEEQLPVGCVRDVDEAQAQLQEEKEYQQGALPSLWP